MNQIFPKIISEALGLDPRHVAGTLQLLDEGATIPFIARYRKERTGGMTDIRISAVSDMYARLCELESRKQTITKTITDAGAMTPELKCRIDACWNQADLEDIYLPYKPRRKTRAAMAREKGLQPLADIIMRQREEDPERLAARYVSDKVGGVEEALRGACDIIAENVSEDSRSRNAVRSSFRRGAVITSKVVKGKDSTEEGQRFKDYFDFSEPLRRCSAHRYLAMRRGEDAGVLRVSLSPGSDEGLDRIIRATVRGAGRCAALVEGAVRDAYRRLILPSIETEFAAEMKQKSDDEAISVFAENLRQLLLSAPLGQKRVMGIDPGFRTGCKVVCLDANGNLLHHTAVFPHPPRGDVRGATETLLSLVSRYAIEAIAIGNGTAGRETERFVRSLSLSGDTRIFMVSEDGASVYSASETAREEFPDEDVTVRGAVSIGRRLMDPLAELVKIDPKSIGVGQYQHDVDQSKLRKSLDRTVESCVNAVGVNLNTASVHLLTYVSGLGRTLAGNIVDYRRQHGDFTSRAELLKVPRLGPAAFRQCAGFLRISDGVNPLDNSAVHPESYPVVERMAADCNCSVAALMADAGLRKGIDIKKYVSGNVGIPTLTDIMAELDKPGRDPRAAAEEFSFDESVDSVESLVPGMELPGIVTNITKFGAFVDIGVHHDGLVHVSQLADRFVSDPMQVVRLHQHVRVRVVEVDMARKRISLSMKGMSQG